MSLQNSKKKQGTRSSSARNNMRLPAAQYNDAIKEVDEEVAA